MPGKNPKYNPGEPYQNLASYWNMMVNTMPIGFDPWSQAFKPVKAPGYNSLLTAVNPPTTPTTPATHTVPATATTPTTPIPWNMMANTTPATHTVPATATTPTVPNMLGGISAYGLSPNYYQPLAEYWNQIYGQPENQPGDMWWSGERTAEGGPNLNWDWWSQLGKNYGLNWGTQYGPNPWGGASNWQQPTANLNERGEVESYNDTRNQWGQPVNTPGPYLQTGGKSGAHGYGSAINPATHDWASTVAKEQAALDRAIAQGAPADRIAWMQARLAKWKEYQSQYGGGGQKTGGYQTYTPNWYNRLTTWKSKG